MAKIDEILNRYKEESIRNVIEAEIIDNNNTLKINGLHVIDLIKVENDEILFISNNIPFRVRCKTIPIKPDITAEGDERYNYLFWIDEKSVQNNIVQIRYLKTGRQENHTDIDLAYGDDIIQYTTRNSSSNVSDIPGKLYSWLAFNAGPVTYLFIETFPNSNKNFRIHGLRYHVDVIIEDGKWVIRRATKKPFPNKFKDFLTYNPVKYKTLRFVEQSLAREALETINLRDKTSGSTLMSLWEKYSAIEQQRASAFKERIGILRYSSARQKNEGLTIIKLEPTEEQKEIFREELDTVLNSSFSLIGRGKKITFKEINTRSFSATIIDDDYTIKQNESGELEVDLTGDETVDKRRKRALTAFKSDSTLVLINLKFAIEDMAEAMILKPRKFKPLSDKTRDFIKKKFGIDNLTDDQKMAVDIAINTPDIAVIQGPPGTGKSTVVAVICHRLMELANKETLTDKVILVSAFQNDTVEHIASKIYTNGLPTLKIGKETQGIRAEDSFIIRMQDSIEAAIHNLAPQQKTNRTSRRLADIKALLDIEGNEDEVKAKISQVVNSEDVSEGLLHEWKELTHSIKIDATDREKVITAIRSLRTDKESYSDDGFIRIRKLLRTPLQLTEEERNFLDEAPDDETELTDEYLSGLKTIQDKYLSQLLSNENEVKGGMNIRLASWLNNAISEFKEKEELSYDEDQDTFLTATLESLREDLFGNTPYIKDSILQYAQSIAATNQFAGSLEASDSNYENVILEEAARSNPLDLLIPMVRASERIIMVGDQFQLPHLLENDIVDEAVQDDTEARKKYKESLFGILFNNLEKANPVRRITLTNQFRMHPVIGDFISRTYYNGIISSDLVDANKKLHGLKLPWAKDKIAIFCDVPKTRGLETKVGRSTTRKVEAERIIQLLDELQRDDAFENLSIGIITFYSKQVDLICELAAEHGYTEMEDDGTYRIKPQYQMTKDRREKLRIGSVDSFQGKEFDIVILSTVRSNNYKRIDENQLRVFGFLTLDNRLNVAFSRAQKMVIAVGDREMFSDEFAETYVKGLYEFNKMTSGEYGNRI